MINRYRVAAIAVITISAATGGFLADTDLSESNRIDISRYSDIERNDSRRINIYERGEEAEWRSEDLTALLTDIRDSDSYDEIIEVNRYPGERPSKEELERSWELYNQSFEAAEENGWLDKEKAFEDGYYDWEWDRRHYPNRMYVRDNRTLDPERPEYLMYYEQEGSDKEMLAGIMYRTTSLEEPGEQIGGPITRWHYHIYPYPKCVFDHGKEPLKVTEGTGCPESSTRSAFSREMIHVWFIDHPETQFSSQMTLPQRFIDEGTEKLSREEFFSKHNRTY